MNICILLAVLVAVAVASVALPPRQTLLRLPQFIPPFEGEPIDITEAPFQVSVQKGEHICGGSIIGSRYILTAAHCTLGLDSPNELSVRVGSSAHASGGHLIPVKNWHFHEYYNFARIDYDFMVLELAEEIVFDETKQPIALPKSVPVDGIMLQVSGWGHTLNPEESGILRRGSVSTVNYEVCKKAYEEINEVTDRMMCAGLEEGGKNSCQGDYGGPLYMNGTLYGVLSWGRGCARPGYPGVYAKVSAVVDWIREIIN